jgi:hypothetical protein
MVSCSGVRVRKRRGVGIAQSLTGTYLVGPRGLDSATLSHFTLGKCRTIVTVLRPGRRPVKA